MVRTNLVPERWYSAMSDGQEKWQWVDEDPIEKLLRPPKNAGRADSHAKSPVEFLEPLRFEEALGSSSTTGDPEPGHPTTNFDCPANLEQSAARTVAADGGGRVVDGYSE